MRNHSNYLRIAMTCFLCMAVVEGARADQIAPSRTLDGKNMTTGKLSVFSEPHGLNVFLDGQSIGKTPIHLKSVAQGTHGLQIESVETTIFIAPGEIHRLSFFKGTFVEIPVEERKSQDAHNKDTSEKAPVQPTEPDNEEKLEPGYFPLNPRGRIY